jgi:hypothetical protein
MDIKRAEAKKQEEQEKRKQEEIAKLNDSLKDL